MQAFLLPGTSYRGIRVMLTWIKECPGQWQSLGSRWIFVTQVASFFKIFYKNVTTPITTNFIRLNFKTTCPSFVLLSPLPLMYSISHFYAPCFRVRTPKALLTRIFLWRVGQCNKLVWPTASCWLHNTSNLFSNYTCCETCNKTFIQLNIDLTKSVKSAN